MCFVYCLKLYFKISKKIVVSFCNFKIKINYLAKFIKFLLLVKLSKFNFKYKKKNYY